MSREQYLWVESHRPHTVKDTILPDSIKSVFQKFVDDGNVPNLLLTGTSGVGKTTVAKAMLDEIGAEYIVINSSLDRGIDVLRNQIANYATTLSLGGGRKYVILDEADYLTPLVQAALRNFMEEFASNCGFILTCNFKSKVLDAIHSRCSVVDFKITPKEKMEIAEKFLQRVFSILKQEGVAFDKQAVAALTLRFFPDFRRVLNELQRFSALGKIDAKILGEIKNLTVDKLFESMKAKDFTKARKWVGENSDMDSSQFFAEMYAAGSDNVAPYSMPAFVTLLGKYQYQAAFVANQEINSAALVAEIMMECEWK